MAQDWDIRARSDACSACTKPFDDRQVCFSALSFGQEGYARADFCEPCWQGEQEGHDPYSTWKGVFRVPPPPPEEPLKKENAESLLRRLMEDDDESQLNVIFILAVMLERKRTLVERHVQRREDGSILRAYEHRETGETFLVPDPSLRLDELEDVQRQVIDMLGGPNKKGETPEAEGEAASPAADVDAESGKAAGIKDGFFSATPASDA